MISSSFKLTTLLKKKLLEVVRYSKYFSKYQYIVVKKSGMIIFAKNIFTFVFCPIKMDLTEVLTLLRENVLVFASIEEEIDDLYAKTTSLKHNLSLTKNTEEISLRELLRTKGLKDSVYIERYINLIYGYVKDKYTSRMVNILKLIDSTQKVVRISTDRTKVVIKNAILRDISMWRSPPNKISLGLNLSKLTA